MFDKLKAASLDARKRAMRDKTSTDAKGLAVVSSILGVLLADVKTRAKNDDDREPSNEDVGKCAQKLLKYAKETLKLNPNEDTLMEIEILINYIPSVMAEEETREVVLAAMDEADVSSMKDMGAVMSALKNEYGSTMDMKLASQIFRNNV